MAETARFFLPRDVEMQMLDEANVIRAQAHSLNERADPMVARRLAELSRTYPGARPGVLHSAAQAALDDDTVQQLVAKDYEAQSEDRGWLGSIKDVASDLANTAGRFLGGAVSAASEYGLKPLARGITTTAEGLFDEIIQRPMIAAHEAEGNLLTNPGAFGEAWKQTGDSVLGQSVKQIASGQRPDLGQGYFAGGGIREEAHSNDLNFQIGGKSANAGRVLTKTTISNLPMVGEYVKPGSKAFDVVSGVAQIGTELAIDPFAKGVKTYQGMRKAARTLSPDKARRLLEETGAAANGANSTVLIERAEKMLGDKDLIRKLTDTTDFDEIWKGSGKQLTPEQALALSETTDDVQTASFLLNEIAHGRVKEKGFYNGFGEVRKAKDRVRLTKQMPGSHIDLSDSRTAVDQLDSLMATVKMAPDIKSKHNAALAKAIRNGSDFDDIETVMRGVHHDMALKFSDEYGIDPDAIKELVEFKKGFTSNNRVYLHDEIGDPLYFPGAKLTPADAQGVERALPTAHMLSEYAQNMYALPDARELRRAAQKWDTLRKVYMSKGWEKSTAGMNKLMGQVWKPMAYVRPAYLFRVPLGEEQVRIWADSDQMIRSPGALFRAIVSDPKKAKDLLGDQLDDIDNFKHAMASGATEQIMDRRFRRTAARGWTTVGREHNNFQRGWKTELNQVAADPVLRGLLTEDDPYDWFLNKGGRTFREQLSKGTNHAKKGLVDDEVARTIKKSPNSDETFESADEMARAYLDTIRGRLDEVAGATADGRAPNPNIMDAIKNETLDDLKLDDFLDSAPQKVKVPLDESVWDDVDGHWFDQIFEAIVIEPTNRVARGQAYLGYQGQAYVDLMDAATPAVREQMIVAARETGQDKAVIRALEKRAKQLRKGDKVGPAPSVKPKIPKPWQKGAYGPMAEDIPTSWLDEIKEFDRNARPGPGRDSAYIDNLAEDMRKNGVQEPLMVDIDPATGRVMLSEGNHRLAAAHRAGIDRLPVRFIKTKNIPAGKGKKISGKRVEPNEHGYIKSDLKPSEAFPDKPWGHLDPEISTQGAPPMVGGGLIDDLADINEMAHWRAGEQVKGLLYDMTRRGHFADATRLIFPFAEAWVEMMTTWRKLLPKNPHILNKARIVMDNGESMGFFEDNDFGDKVFNYPGGGKLYEFANGGGGQIQMQGRLAGMNMLATGVGPGFGPLVQWPVSAFIEDSPDLQWFKDAVAPFGSDLENPSDILDPSKVGSEFAPAWAKKVLGALSNGKFGREEDYHRTIGDVATILAESGDYQPGDPQLMKDAESQGKFIHLIRGFAQAILPTGPELSYEFKDESGKWLTMRTLAEGWREIRQETEDDVEATKIFNQRYGMEPWFVAASKSQTLRYRPTDKAGDTWMQKNKQLAEHFPNTVGYFAPSGGDFSFDAWRRNFSTGDSEAYTPEQRIAIAEKQKAWMIFNRQQQLTEGMDPAAREEYLSDIKVELEEDFPGWTEQTPGVRETASRDLKIAELRNAVKDPRLSKTESGKALSIFFDRYDEAVAIRNQRDPSAKSFGAKRDADLIQYLSEVGNDLAADMPEFHGMWTYIFEPEFS